MRELPKEVERLEKEKQVTTNALGYYDNMFVPVSASWNFLYHGIRFQNHLEKLENIFKMQKLLAGKYIEGYMNYGDNCNKGEYVSLLKWMEYTSLEYRTFIFENISLIISPKVNAIETKYLSIEDWIKIKNLELNNLYSYMRGECLVKDFIPLNYVKAVGVPYTYWCNINKEELAINLLNDLIALMDEYEVMLPIVDTSRYNDLLVDIDRGRYYGINRRW